jgi:hypothetical protein
LQYFVARFLKSSSVNIVVIIPLPVLSITFSSDIHWLFAMLSAGKQRRMHTLQSWAKVETSTSHTRFVAGGLNYAYTCEQGTVNDGK